MASPNPYRPGFSQAPEVLAGREDVLAASRSAMDTAAAGRTPRPLVLIGARGVGKTVLLAEIAQDAAMRLGWPRLRVEVAQGGQVTAQLIARAEALVAALDPRRDRLRSTDATVRAGIGGVGAEVHFARSAGRQPSLDDQLRLEAALGTLADTLAGRSSGMVLTIDETQLARRADLGVVAACLQAGTEKAWPIVTVMAGLATMRNSERSVTYLERGEWHDIGLLDEADALLALTRPAAAAGRPMEPVAAQLISEHAGGYPYAVQLYGHHAWIASEGQERIDAVAATAAVAAAARELDRSLYSGRWGQASRREKQYLVGVADVMAAGRPATGGAVAALLGKSTPSLSSYRDRLISKGTLFVSEGRLGFVVPGMADYVRRHRGDADDAGGQQGGP